MTFSGNEIFLISIPILIIFNANITRNTDWDIWKLRYRKITRTSTVYTVNVLYDSGFIFQTIYRVRLFIKFQNDA